MRGAGPSKSYRVGGSLTTRARQTTGVPGNRSLDEFVGAEEADEPPDEPEPAGDAVSPETVDDPDEAAVEPMAETFAWSPAGDACAVCGETVEERWRDGDELVCGECKAW